jgi:hypothetical protein
MGTFAHFHYAVNAALITGMIRNISTFYGQRAANTQSQALPWRQMDGHWAAALSAAAELA